MIGNTVSLDDSFGASSVHAKLSVLVIIASAFRSHLTDLMTAADRDGAPPEGMQIVDAMAETLSSQIGAIRTLSAAPVVWTQFRGRLAVAWSLRAQTTLLRLTIERGARLLPRLTTDRFCRFEVRSVRWLHNVKKNVVCESHLRSACVGIIAPISSDQFGAAVNFRHQIGIGSNRGWNRLAHRQRWRP